MTTSQETSTWSSREPPPPQMVGASMYTRHSAYSTVSTPRAPNTTTTIPKTSYTAKTIPTVPASNVRKNNQMKRYTIEDFRGAFHRKGLDLDTSKKLGRGKYSKVYKANDTKNKRFVAVKVIDVLDLTSDVKNKFLPREINCWRRLKHPFIVGLHAQYEAHNMIFLSMEYGSQGDLLRFVQQNGGIKEQQASLFMAQLIQGLDYMHSKQIAHRDIKLENIILFGDCVKLSDFGFVRQVESDDVSQTFCGSKSYSAPELLRGIGYNPFLSDVWSLGVVCFVMVTNRMPFDEKKPNNVIVSLQEMRQYVIPPYVYLSPTCISSFEEMMTFDVRKRPTSAQCLRLPWISRHLSPSRQQLD